jgi:hypothetical protein
MPLVAPIQFDDAAPEVRAVHADLRATRYYELITRFRQAIAKGRGTEVDARFRARRAG